ncbi:MAG TPA: hypothetical protein VHH73_10335, partial [Verrucomicrobiae bacterium]|nr:hypothetical protein [Verrucomicrobiae bacterium]
VAKGIDRSDFKQKTIHKVASTIASSRSLKPLERRLAFTELLWPCSESFDSTYITLAHMIRHIPAAAPQVVIVLERWHLVGNRALDLSGSVHHVLE